MAAEVGMQGSEQGPELLDAAQAARYLSLSEGHLASMRFKNATVEGPPYIKLGNGPFGRIRYRRSDLDLWLKSRTVYPAAPPRQPEADAGQAPPEVDTGT